MIDFEVGNLVGVSVSWKCCAILIEKSNCAITRELSTCARFDEKFVLDIEKIVSLRFEIVVFIVFNCYNTIPKIGDFIKTSSIVFHHLFSEIDVIVTFGMVHVALFYHMKKLMSD